MTLNIGQNRINSAIATRQDWTKFKSDNPPQNEEETRLYKQLNYVNELRQSSKIPLCTDHPKEYISSWIEKEVKYINTIK